MKKNKENWQGVLDRIGASFGAFMYRKNRFFRETTHAKPLREVLPQTRLELDSMEPGAWQKVTAKSPVGTFTGGVLVHRWMGDDVPTIIFIHGSGEQPQNFGAFGSNSFRKIFTKAFDVDANLILLMAPFHDGTQKDYIKALGSLSNYVGMLATTTALLDAVASRLRKNGFQHRIYAAGVSLGGWVVNLHRAYFKNHVDGYIPMIAGTRLHDVFTTSDYSRLIDEKALAQAKLLEDLLNFEEDYLSNKRKDCHPLIARYDKLVELPVQQRGYRGMELNIIDKGHFTGMEAVAAFRHHMKSVILS